jgi:uncharacterized membrane protein YphA (DoxX/SURF4 family)
MTYLLTILQLLVAGVLINVWVVRFNKGTDYRGKSARNMREEFAAYGLPGWFMWLVGTLKLTSAAALIFGIWLPEVIFSSAVVLLVLMTGAIAMHLRAGDPFVKFVPALVMLLLSVIIAILSLP